jgi:predicted MFS family arabinose efflux permease
VASALVRADIARTPAADADEASGGVREGVRIIRRHPPLTALLSTTGLSAVAQGLFVVLFVVFVVEELDGGGAEVGTIRGIMAIGGLLGALVIARLAKRLDAGLLIAVGFLGMGAMSFLFWNAPSVTTALWVYFVLFAASGIPGAALQVGFITTVQKTSPPESLGRVVGVMGASEAAGNAVGSLLAGFLVDTVRLSALLNAQMGIYLLCGVLAALTLVRRRER